jgi:hypothetical protein
MTRDDITRIAREAGFVGFDGDNGSLRRFAGLIAAAEREAVCRIVTGLCISDNNAEEINRAIRARGQDAA